MPDESDAEETEESDCQTITLLDDVDDDDEDVPIAMLSRNSKRLLAKGTRSSGVAGETCGTSRSAGGNSDGKEKAKRKIRKLIKQE